jgi:hypothetical protein
MAAATGERQHGRLRTHALFAISRIRQWIVNSDTQRLTAAVSARSINVLTVARSSSTIPTTRGGFVRDADVTAGQSRHLTCAYGRMTSALI